jgi:hypothetical protein
MKTRYEILLSAGDLLDSAIKRLSDAGEPELASEAQTTLNKLYKAQDEAWKPEYAEPELETA